MEKFSWKSGTQFPVDAKIAADTIRNLQRTLGKDTITAKELLDVSRDPNAPLHSCFEWNDSIAAEKFRVDQARRIIGSIEVQFVDDDAPEHLTKTRYMVSVVPVAPKLQGEFAPIDIVRKNPDYYKQVLQNALNDLRAFQRRYSDIQELSGVFKAINDFGDTIK